MVGRSGNCRKPHNYMRKAFTFVYFFLQTISLFSQRSWVRVDSLYTPLPSSIQVWKSITPVDNKPSIVYLVRANLSDPNLIFTADTSYKRRLTPRQFFEKNKEPLLVVNTSFFSFTTNQNLNVLIRDGIQLAFQVHAIPGKGRDTLTWKHPLGSAIGINKKLKADVAWVFTDSFSKYPLAIQAPVSPLKDSHSVFTKKTFKALTPLDNRAKRWKMKTAVGGGPVLVQRNAIAISNEQEMKFTGRAIEDRHPRTAIGYSKDGWLLILVAEGRRPGIAEGLTLKQTAQLLLEWDCEEGLNLDGGGSSSLLINGKRTITPSDKEGERAVPGVFLIHRKN